MVFPYMGNANDCRKMKNYFKSLSKELRALSSKRSLSTISTLLLEINDLKLLSRIARELSLKPLCDLEKPIDMITNEAGTASNQNFRQKTKPLHILGNIKKFISGVISILNLKTIPLPILSSNASTSQFASLFFRKILAVSSKIASEPINHF